MASTNRISTPFGIGSAGNHFADQRVRAMPAAPSFVEVDRFGAGDDERQTLGQQHHAERGDERRNLHLAIMEAGKETAEGAEEDGADHADPERQPQ